MSGITVLIVDDSSVMRKIVERALRQAGLNLAKVVEAGSGREGLEALGREPVGLIVSDINMPSMDGLEFLRQIQSQGLARGVPVVMITTESGEEHVREALAAERRDISASRSHLIRCGSECCRCWFPRRLKQREKRTGRGEKWATRWQQFPEWRGRRRSHSLRGIWIRRRMKCSAP
jgi:two-component system chemotaxis response regulator CheY